MNTSKAKLLTLAAATCVLGVAIVCGLRPSHIKRLRVPSTSAETTIQAGYGLPFCYVGMSEYMLSSDWAPGPELYSDVYYKPNSAKEGHFFLQSWGVNVTSRNRKIVGIVIKLTLEAPDLDTGVFGGKCERGVTRSSSIQDIFRAYGEPDAIANTIDTSTNTRQVDLDYFSEGIAFNFVNKKIHLVRIGPKMPPPFDPFLSEDIGDTRALRELAKRITSDKKACDSRKVNP